MLTALGLSADEEEIYRHLVVCPETGADKLAADIGLDAGRAAALLAGLVARGIAVADGDSFSAAPPSIALGALLRRQHDDLRAAEIDMADLSERHRTAESRRGASAVVEVLTDVDAVRHRFAQLQESARSEVRSIVVPRQHVVPHTANTTEAAGLRRGVRYRVIVARAALPEPGLVASAIVALRDGAEIRVVDTVPVKMIIVDSDVAMVPLVAQQHTAAASVVVRRSGVLDALTALFELTWERAYPLSMNAVGDALVERRPHDIDEVDAQVLTLLLAGLTDQAVAGQLGMSLRTLQRRISALMEKAGVETRLQLGWHAARSSWA